MTTTTKKHLHFALIAVALVCALTVLVGLTAPTATAAENATPVAKVGSTEYTSIDDAVANWTNGTTLTLLSDVTLSDVVKLKSTEAHTLNLATYTLTAASGQHAIEVTCNGRSSASYALTVNADANNPGGINAPGKSCIYYRKIGTTKDRPIILINNGVFNGSYSVNFTSNGNTNCPQLWVNNGTFNGNVSLTKCMLQVRGGFFNCSINCTGDTNAYRLISGGTFKNWQFMTADANTKFTVGSSKTVYDKGAYVNEEGYLVVGGAPLTEPGTMGASTNGTNSNSTWSSYLKYSSAKDTLYWEDAEAAIEFLSSKTVTNKPATEITVYENEIDLTDSAFKGKIVVPTGSTLAITFDEGTTPAWTVVTNDDTKMVVSTEAVENGKVVVSYSVKTKQTVSFDTLGGSTVPSGVAPNGGVIVDEIPTPTMEGHTFAGWYTDPACAEGTEWDVEADTVTADLTLYAKWTLNKYTVTYDYGTLGTQTAEAYWGDVLTETTPEFVGYVFMGWFADDQFQTAYDFSAKVTSDVTLYAELLDVDQLVGRVSQVEADMEAAQTALQDVVANKASADELAQAVAALTNAINTAQTTAEASAAALDATLKADLQSQIATAEVALQAAVNQVAADLEAAKTQLQAAIDTKANASDLTNAVAALTAAVNNAQATAEASAASNDAALKADLETQLAAAKGTLQASVNQVASDLEAAKTQLQAAIDTKANASDLANAVASLTAAISNAQTTAANLDQAMKAELETSILVAEKVCLNATQKVADDLAAAKTQLQAAIDTKATAAEVQTAVTELSTAINNAQAVSVATAGQLDEALKAEMESNLAAAQTALQASISTVQSNLDAATAQLQAAINTKATNEQLAEAVSTLNAAVAAAQTAAEATAAAGDVALKAELEGAIANAKTATESSIRQVQASLDAATNQLQAAIDSKVNKSELDQLVLRINETVAQLQTFVASYEGLEGDIQKEIDSSVAAVKAEILDIVYAGDKQNADKLLETENKFAQINAELKTKVLVATIVSAVALAATFVLVMVLVSKKRKTRQAALPAGTKMVQLKIDLQ